MNKERYPVTVRFIEKMVCLQPDNSVTLLELHEAYLNYCFVQEKKPAQSKRLFMKELKAIMEDQVAGGDVVIENRGPVKIKGIRIAGGTNLSIKDAKVSKEANTQKEKELVLA